MSRHGIVCALLAYLVLHVHIVRSIPGDLVELTVTAYAMKFELIDNLIRP